MLTDLLEYEFALVGAPLVHWERAQELRGLLAADEFSDTRCSAVWSAFLASVGLDDFTHSLGQHKLVSFASGCSDLTYATALGLWPWLATTIRQEAKRRRVQQRLFEIQSSDTEDIVADLAALVEAEQGRMAGDNCADLPQRLADEFIAELDRSDLSERIMTGIKSVDAMVGGFRKGNVSVIGAEPSVGKTALALNIAAHNVRKGKKVVIFSLEMAAVQLMERLVAAEEPMDYRVIGDRSFASGEREACADRAHLLTEDNLLYIFDDCFLVEQMGNHIMRIKPDLVIVDFLQFCRTAERRDNTADRLEYIVSEFKRLAKLSYCRSHIMLLSQPNRQATKEGSSMFAMKGSSGIEQGGDVILLLDRPVVRDPAYSPERASIRVAKNKFGSTGEADIYFEGRYQLFRDTRIGDCYSQVGVKEGRPEWGD